ncbi:MAG: pyruvate dehydrogenase (acetyl-transferring) E1 component subunit alpha, partial [Proteobacteria bacterium]|nr:pyruvate dehydrogenase (acetyl-transferring) E1 component subunit alpha [Pseudomonadota bacterium]
DAMRKQRDPIDALREILINDGVENDKIKSLDTKVKAIVSKASYFALESPEPDEAELWTDVILEGGVS